MKIHFTWTESDMDFGFTDPSGMDDEWMKLVTVVLVVCSVVLFLYRLYIVVDCMRRNPDEFPSHVDRVVWPMLAVFIPLGIGAYLYELVIRKNPASFFFLFPLGIILLCYSFVFLKIYA